MRISLLTDRAVCVGACLRVHSVFVTVVYLMFVSTCMHVPMMTPNINDVYVRVCIPHAYVCACTCLYLYAFMPECLCTCMCQSVCLCVCIGVWLCAFVCVCVMNGPVPGNVPLVALDQSAYLLAASPASD